MIADHGTVLFRIVVVALVIAVLVAAWWRGERTIRRTRVPVDYRSAVHMFVALWRLLMLSVTLVAVVTIAGLWWAQDASDEARTVAAETDETAQDLCLQTAHWQRAAVEVREADVRIVEAELRIARAELADAQTVLAEALEVIEADGEDSPAESFFRTTFERDVERTETKVVELEAERDRRRASFDRLSDTALDACPPIHGGTD